MADTKANQQKSQTASSYWQELDRESDRRKILADMESLADQMTALAVRHHKASEEFHALTIINSAAIVRMAFENLQSALQQPVPERTDWSKKVGVPAGAACTERHGAGPGQSLEIQP